MIKRGEIHNIRSLGTGRGGVFRLLFVVRARLQKWPPRRDFYRPGLGVGSSATPAEVFDRCPFLTGHCSRICTTFSFFFTHLRWKRIYSSVIGGFLPVFAQLKCNTTLLVLQTVSCNDRQTHDFSPSHVGLFVCFFLRGFAPKSEVVGVNRRSEKLNIYLSNGCKTFECVGFVVSEISPFIS